MSHRYWWLILGVTAVTVVLCVFGILSLQIKTGYVDLLPQEHPEVKNYFKVLEKFGGTDYLLSMVEVPRSGDDQADLEKVRSRVDRLAAELDETGEFDYIQDRVDLEQFSRYGLLYLPTETLKEIDLLLSERDFDTLTEYAASFMELRDRLTQSMGPGLSVDEQGYFTTFTDDSVEALVIARPGFGTSEAGDIREFGGRMARLTEGFERENPGTRVWLSGTYQFEYEQRNVLNRDMVVVGLIALSAIALILAIAFKSVVTPIAAMIALACGMIWTLGLARGTVKSLNTVSSVFVIVLMGIGIEYGIALLSRYREERGRGRGSEEAFVNALRSTGKGIITGALTTAGAFFALAFSDFKAMHDMGIVLGMGVLCALVSALFVLPAMMTLKERFFPYKSGEASTESRIMRRLGGVVSRQSTIFVVTGLLITIGFAVSASFMGFESDVRKIQPRGMEVTEAEEKLAEDFGMVSNFVIVLSNNEAAMREITEELTPQTEEEALESSISSVESLATVVPSDQLTKLVYMSRIKNKIEKLNPEWLDFVPEEMLSILENIGSDLLTPDKLPSDVYSNYVSDDGTFAVYVYPKKDMRLEENAVEFLEEVESVSTDLSGYPAIILDSIESTRAGLQETTLLSAIAVMLMVVIDFKAIIPTVLALLPLLLSMVWMMGAINIFGMKFNLVNIAGAPIILGIGVDFGVYVLHRYKEEYESEGATIPSVLAHTGKAIMVSGFTVIIAFAALIFARYQGLASLGIVASLGIAFAAISAVTILPALLQILERVRKKKRAF